MTEITDQELIESLSKVVAREGSLYTYFAPAGGAKYFTNEGKPSCLWGHVLDDLGLAELFGALEDVYDTIDVLLQNYTSGLSDAVMHAANESQSMQDASMPWGYAYEAFWWILRNWEEEVE